MEIDKAALAALSEGRVRRIREFVDEHTLADGRRLNLLGEGRLVNLAAAEGHPAAVMDMSFANQALCVEWLVKNHGGLEAKVYPVPTDIDEEVARLKLRGDGRGHRHPHRRAGDVPPQLGRGNVALEAVRIRAHFERFPASLKGSLVMRGADGNPHQVRLDDARAVELAGRGPVSMGDGRGDARGRAEPGPVRSVRIPGRRARAGWYAIECDVAIDGAPETVRPGARFAVPWPRGATRRDQVRVGKSIETGAGTVRIDELGCDERFHGAPVRRGRRRRSPLAADGVRLPLSETTSTAGRRPGPSSRTPC